MNNHDSSVTKRLLAVTVFSSAMGFLEATVVIYLRELYYPGGFAFPLKSLLSQGLLIEFIPVVWVLT